VGDVVSSHLVCGLQTNTRVASALASHMFELVWPRVDRLLGTRSSPSPVAPTSPITLPAMPNDVLNLLRVENEHISRAELDAFFASLRPQPYENTFIWTPCCRVESPLIHFNRIAPLPAAEPPQTWGAWLLSFFWRPPTLQQLQEGHWGTKWPAYALAIPIPTERMNQLFAEDEEKLLTLPADEAAEMRLNLQEGRRYLASLRDGDATLEAALSVGRKLAADMGLHGVEAEAEGASASRRKYEQLAWDRPSPGVDPEGRSISFLTAWSSTTPILEALSKQHPSLDLALYSFNEFHEDHRVQRYRGGTCLEDVAERDASSSAPQLVERVVAAFGDGTVQEATRLWQLINPPNDS
jgi:hypothetical protein